jgi:hypothetical protein
MSHSFRHPTIERESIESNHAPVFHEGDLSAPDAVVERVDAHAQVARRGIDIEPSWFNDRILGALARFHDVTPEVRAVVVVRRRDRGPGPTSRAVSGAALGSSGSV